MIVLHRLGQPDEPFQLNPDLIVTIESTPDTVVTLATTAKVVVAESPEEVAASVRAWRVEVLSEAMRNRRPESERPNSRDRAESRPLFAAENARLGSGSQRRARPCAHRAKHPPKRPGQVEGLRSAADERGR